jgi:glucokinase
MAKTGDVTSKLALIISPQSNVFIKVPLVDTTKAHIFKKSSFVCRFLQFIKQECCRLAVPRLPSGGMPKRF